MNRIPILQNIFNFAAKSPSQLILYSHVNSIFKETLEFYAFELWQRWASSSSNPKLATERKFVLMHIACKHGIEWIVRRLLQGAQQLDEENKQQQEQQIESSISTSSFFVQSFLNSKDSKYASPTLGYTNLMIASIHGKSTQVIETLLHYGAKVLTTDLLGKSAIELACEGGHPEVLRILLSASWLTKEDITPNGRYNYITGTEIVPLRVAILYNRVSCAEVLINQFNCDLSHVDNIGRSLLYQSARQGCVEITKMIVAKCPKRILFLRDPERRTAVDAARDRSHTEIVKILQDAICAAEGVKGSKEEEREEKNDGADDDDE